MKLFNCKIVEWHYILIFYYNSKNKKDNIYYKNLEKCKEKGILFIFYDPVTQIFYDSTRKNIINITPNEVSNLDCIKINEKKFSMDTNKIFNRRAKDYVKGDFKKQKDSFIKDLKKICEDENPTIIDILKKLRENLGFSGRCRLTYVYQFPFTKDLISTPNKDFIHLYKKKESKDYIALKKVKGKLKILNASKKKEELDHFYNYLDENAKYYYCLGIIKRRKLKENKDKRSTSFKKIMFIS